MNNKIRFYREKNGLTQSALAAKIGWNVSRLSNYEQKIRTPGLIECRAIVNALQTDEEPITVDDVFPPR